MAEADEDEAAAVAEAEEEDSEEEEEEEDNEIDPYRHLQRWRTLQEVEEEEVRGGVCSNACMQRARSSRNRGS